MGEPSGMRYVHPAYFDSAPRFHSGVGPDEMAAILHKNEGVFTPAQMRALAPAGAGGGNMTVNINNSSGGEVKTNKRRQGNVDVLDVFISAVGAHMARGGFDPQLKARTGTKKPPFGR